MMEFMSFLNPKKKYDFCMIQYMFFYEFVYALCFNCLHFLFYDFFKLFIDSIHFEKKPRLFNLFAVYF